MVAEAKLRLHAFHSLWSAVWRSAVRARACARIVKKEMKINESSAVYTPLNDAVNFFVLLGGDDLWRSASIDSHYEKSWARYQDITSKIQ